MIFTDYRASIFRYDAYGSCVMLRLGAARRCLGGMKNFLCHELLHVVDYCFVNKKGFKQLLLLCILPVVSAPLTPKSVEAR